MNYEQARQLLHAENQLHVLTFWDGLSAAQRELLLRDIAGVDWSAIHEATRSPTAESWASDMPILIPPTPVCAARADDPSPVVRSVLKSGERLLRENRVAALTVAGGQGTRLGFPGPKGLLPITPVRNKSLFQHFAEGIAATNIRYGCDVPWYIMTSLENDAATRKFFEQHDFFGLSAERIRFFEQGTMPALSLDGKLLLAERHRLALAPDGHGGVLEALRRCGGLDELTREGREYLSFFQIDNPLITVLDPGFLGAVHELDSDVGSKVVRKRDEHEKAGVFAIQNGKLRVIEYDALPEELAHRRNGKKWLTYGLANVAAHVFRASLIDKVARGGPDFQLPWHRARKKTAYVDMETGVRIEPQQPNAIKLEQFIFDALTKAYNPILYEVPREDEFSPVKNATGEDSPQTARQDLSRKAARWLKECGVWPDDTHPTAVEISPLFALDAPELKARLKSIPKVDATGQVYLGL